MFTGELDTDGKRAAIVDFAYNLGTGALRRSTLRKRIIDGSDEDIKKELFKWVKGGGKTLPGLVKRRAAEWMLFITD